MAMRVNSISGWASGEQNGAADNKRICFTKSRVSGRAMSFSPYWTEKR